MLEYIESDLVHHLKKAKAISIAVALIKDYGLRAIEDNVPLGCVRKYLVGIHLPTPPKILRQLLELQTERPHEIISKIYTADENYHPKVYLIEKNNDELIAFVGSANATRGGFTHNIEMNFAITEQKHCEKIRDWFNRIFAIGSAYDEDYIIEYEKTYRRNKFLASTQKSNTKKLVVRTPPVTNTLQVRQGQFFRQSDFDAFGTLKQLDTGSVAVEARAQVRKRFLELHDSIFDLFPQYGITNLNHPANRRNYTSQHFHSRGNNDILKEAIWLNYGRSPEELQQYNKFYKSFVNHVRIQIILRNTAERAYIGIWLYIGKPGSSYHDRANLKTSLESKDYSERLYEYLMDLGGSYWIAIGNDEMWISEIKSIEDLVSFLKRDNYSGEFIIGQDYDPNDSELSEENISETVLIEFSKLYKIYDLIKAPH